jgi:hypothetical protein
MMAKQSKEKAPVAQPTTRPTIVYIDDWSLDTKNRPLETNFMSTDDFWPRSRESLDLIREAESPHPMPDIFERMSRYSLSAHDVDAPLLGPEPLNESWVQARNAEYIAEVL